MKCTHMFRYLWIAGMVALTGAGVAVEGSTSASAQIDVPITVQLAASPTNGNLAFGSILPYGAPGTVVINPTTGNRSGTTVGLLPSLVGPAKFFVYGWPNSAFTITLPLAAVTLAYTAHDSQTYSMSVDSWTCDDTNQAMMLDGGGGAYFQVGGTLHVGANQHAGTYAGSFTVMVAYN
jgi:hypothetical protein